MGNQCFSFTANFKKTVNNALPSTFFCGQKFNARRMTFVHARGAGIDETENRSFRKDNP